MAPKTRPAVMKSIDPNGDEIVINDSYGNDICIQVCGSAASKVSIRISGPRSFEISTRPRTRPDDPLKSVAPHPRSAGGGTDASTDGTRQPSF